MDDAKFREKVMLISDPYYDREFFTNLIYCIDRDKSPREVFEAFVRELNGSKAFPEDLDRAYLHLFFAFQVSSLVKDNYQWLPLTQGMYSAALYRSEGRHHIGLAPDIAVAPQAVTVDEFSEWVRTDAREVESFRRTWAGLLFLLDNRTTRAAAVAAVIKQAQQESDDLTFELLVKGFDLALAAGWRANATILRRPFERFWDRKSKATWRDLLDGVRLGRASRISFSSDKQIAIGEQDLEELWRRASQESAESVWECCEKLAAKGVLYDALVSALTILRGRALFAMKTEHWARVSESLMRADALQGAARWVPEERISFMASEVCELSRLVQLVGSNIPTRPTGDSVLEKVSKTISKDRLVLRLDDSAERGLRTEALELFAAILDDEGLSNTVSDRLLLMASKQDGWTFEQRTLPTAFIVVRAYEACHRQGTTGAALKDALFGLLRFLCDEREISMQVVPRTGTYGEGMKVSQFDVSGGARVVDRFVFNQMRNAQRVKVWPSDN